MTKDDVCENCIYLMDREELDGSENKTRKVRKCTWIQPNEDLKYKVTKCNKKNKITP